MREGPNRDFYLKKRGEGHGHVQALIALARRRVDVLWALLRDNRVFNATKPAAKAVDNVIENPWGGDVRHDERHVPRPGDRRSGHNQAGGHRANPALHSPVGGSRSPTAASG